MTKEQLAELLNGREYRNEITKEESIMAKDNGLVVVFGASEDLLEFRGAMYEEYGYEAVFTKDGEIFEDCEDHCVHSQLARENANKIEGEYTAEGWKLSTEIPHAKFLIKEDEIVYGEGLVFEMKDLK